MCAMSSSPDEQSPPQYEEDQTSPVEMRKVPDDCWNPSERLSRTLNYDREYRQDRGRLIWAMKNIEHKVSGVRANALNICSRYYLFGWHVKEDKMKSRDMLKKAAKLGHGQACYDLAEVYLNMNWFEETDEILMIGLENIADASFNCRKDDYIQENFKGKLCAKLRVSEFYAQYRPFGGNVAD